MNCRTIGQIFLEDEWCWASSTGYDRATAAACVGVEHVWILPVYVTQRVFLVRVFW